MDQPCASTSQLFCRFHEITYSTCFVYIINIHLKGPENRSNSTLSWLGRNCLSCPVLLYWHKHSPWLVSNTHGHSPDLRMLLKKLLEGPQLQPLPRDFTLLQEQVLQALIYLPTHRLSHSHGWSRAHDDYPSSKVFTQFQRYDHSNSCPRLPVLKNSENYLKSDWRQSSWVLRAVIVGSQNCALG